MISRVRKGLKEELNYKVMTNKKYEYKMIQSGNTPIMTLLNKFGQEGWELCCMNESKCFGKELYFKRAYYDE